MFLIIAKDGYELLTAQAVDKRVTGSSVPLMGDLSKGFSLIGFVAVPADATAFDVLQAPALGSSIVSISRLNQDTGRYETAVINGGSAVGIDFPLARGIGYAVSMHDFVPDFTIP